MTRRSNAALHLEVKASHTALTEGEVYDMAAIRVRILDNCDSPAPYAQLPVRFRAEGPVELVGPDVVTAEGGMCGAYVRTTGTGTAQVTISADGLEPVTVWFEIR